MAIKLSIPIHDNQAFFMTPIEMINKIEKIFKMNCEVVNMTNKLPITAIKFLINKSLKDEITITNEIEGVSSTRKEIEEAVLNQNNKKKARFKG